MVREIKTMGYEIRVGRHYCRILRMVYEKVVIPTTYKMETTTTHKTNKMVMIQGKMLRKYTTYLHQVHTGGY